MITVRQLIQDLLECDMDAVVVIAKDAEGNDYSPLGGIDDGHNGEMKYQEDSSWSGEVNDEEGASGIPCVVLSPIN